MSPTVFDVLAAEHRRDLQAEAARARLAARARATPRVGATRSVGVALALAVLLACAWAFPPVR